MPVNFGNGRSSSSSSMNGNGQVKVVKRGIDALEAWGRRITTGYQNVHINDLTTSWRDGLAFCAIIHYFRPDLIDYDNLKKDDILHNNRLAFHLAKEHFSIPELLDAEDMLKHIEPDKRSIALYLSEFYNYFENGKRRPPIPSTDTTTTNENKSLPPTSVR
ncbi:MICAL-like protein 2 [Dermatophagoides pteronyssinus]|uniref:MICAL-like protein 2 n=1 Tax=Dermatophagoides pteronyssinus TaxID=6956 RepID=UPI003F666A65